MRLWKPKRQKPPGDPGDQVKRMTDTAELTKPETAAQLLKALAAECGAMGFQRELDAQHSVTFIDRGPDLLVTFEPVGDTLARGSSGLPLGLDFVEDKNWSLLHFSANAETWFRSEAMYGFVDELVDDAFFENFDQVTFYGSGMGGYAAAAYSVAAPGAVVVALSPQATLARWRTEWETRFLASRRMKFDDRYGYAPEMLEGSSAAFILYDPTEQLDTVHANHFVGPNIHALKCRHFRDRIEVSLQEMNLLHQIIEKAGAGELTPTEFYKLLRARRENSRFLRNLLFHLDDLGNPMLMALFCSNVLSRMQAPAFRKRLNIARDALEMEGRLPDWLEKQG